jgi:hypothetical protein
MARRVRSAKVAMQIRARSGFGKSKVYVIDNVEDSSTVEEVKEKIAEAASISDSFFLIKGANRLPDDRTLKDLNIVDNDLIKWIIPLPEYKPTGIKNIGNSCYMNGVVQFLFSDEFFWKMIWYGEKTPLRDLLAAYGKASKTVTDDKLLACTRESLGITDGDQQDANDQYDAFIHGIIRDSDKTFAKKFSYFTAGKTFKDWKSEFETFVSRKLQDDDAWQAPMTFLKIELFAGPNAAADGNPFEVQRLSEAELRMLKLKRIFTYTASDFEKMSSADDVPREDLVEQLKTIERGFVDDGTHEASQLKTIIAATGNTPVGTKTKEELIEEYERPRGPLTLCVVAPPVSKSYVLAELLVKYPEDVVTYAKNRPSVTKVCAELGRDPTAYQTNFIEKGAKDRVGYLLEEGKARVLNANVKLVPSLIVQLANDDNVRLQTLIDNSRIDQCEPKEMELHCDRVTVFSRLPELLVVVVRRVIDFRGKRKSKALILGLNEPLSLVDVFTDETHEYNLRAAVVHQGADAKDGHYVAYLKNSKGHVLANDSNISSISEGDFLAGCAMGNLFLFRRNDTL